MLTKLSVLKNYSIKASDGEIGSIFDFYFDDRKWVIRYFVIDTGNWLTGRRVLLSPSVFSLPDENVVEFFTTLTREQIKNSPSSDADKPVSRQYEENLRAYYGWPAYWYGTMPTSTGGMAEVPPEGPDREPVESDDERKGDPHLRSYDEVTGYHIEAADGEIGHVEDFILDTNGWQIRYMIVDTRNWLPGKKVLVSLGWIQGISWEASMVYVSLTKDKVKNSPEYDSDKSIERNYEEALFEHYGRKRYWNESKFRKSA